MKKPPLHLVVEPIPGAQTEVGRGLWALERTRARLSSTLQLTHWTPVDWQPESGVPSIGTLLYHIALVEAELLYKGVLEEYDKPFPAEIEALLSYPKYDGNQLYPVTGISLDEHIQRLATVRQRLLNTYRAMTVEDFRRVRLSLYYEVTPEGILYYLCQHEAERRAEIEALNRQFRSR